MADPFEIILAPNPVFRQKAELVNDVNDGVRDIIARMFATMEAEHAVGIGANMVGILKRIIVVKLNEGNAKEYAMINPKIISKSKEMQKFEEASVCFPGISAIIERPKNICVEYQDEQGEVKSLEAEGFLATVIQHEMDYLDGKIFVDYLSKMKRDMLLKKSEKFIKQNPPHIHTADCRHGV